jgi:hypothetical protein
MTATVATACPASEVTKKEKHHGAVAVATGGGAAAGRRHNTMTIEEQQKVVEVEATLDDCWLIDDGCFGACALCGPEDDHWITTLGKSDWCYCEKHRIAWSVGYGNSSSWKHLGRYGQIANALWLDGFQVIENGRQAGYVFEADTAIKFINEFWNGGDDDDDEIDLRADHGA